ncbi:uncharacterized protein LOC142500903 [Ascaphus truei]|uniref:uncharacterized protein LOC142500903 n=1 Tax=Ascaphus truei TaxID=8439 RepID=UPI003F5ACF51
MAFILNLTVAFGVFIATCNAACHFDRLQLKNPFQVPTGCWYEDELHPFFTRWISDHCEECVCGKRGMECCDHNTIAVGFNPKICESIFIKENCTFKVVRRKNPEVSCPFKTEKRNSDSTDSSDSRDSRDSKDRHDRKDSSDNRDSKDRHDRKDSNDSRDSKDRHDRKDSNDSRDSKDRHDRKDSNDSRDSKDRHDRKDSSDTRDSKDRHDRKDSSGY